MVNSAKAAAVAFVTLAVVNCADRSSTAFYDSTAFNDSPIGYDCFRESDEPFGRVTVGMYLSPDGRFQSSSLTVRIPVGSATGDALYIRRGYKDDGLSEPDARSVLQVVRGVQTAVVLPSTLFLTLDGGEQVRAVVIDASRAGRDRNSGGYAIWTYIKDQEFIAAFEKANSFVLDVIDTNNRYVVHEVHTTDRAVLASAISRLRTETLAAAATYKKDCRAEIVQQ